MSNKNQKIIQKIKYAIDTDVKNNCCIKVISLKFNIPIRMLEDLFKHIYRSCPKEYIDKTRIEKLSDLLKNSNNGHPNETYSIALELGYFDSTGLYKFVKSQTGHTYKEYKKLIASQTK